MMNSGVQMTHTVTPALAHPVVTLGYMYCMLRVFLGVLDGCQHVLGGFGVFGRVPTCARGFWGFWTGANMCMVTGSGVGNQAERYYTSGRGERGRGEGLPRGKVCHAAADLHAGLGWGSLGMSVPWNAYCWHIVGAHTTHFLIR